jgi:hypothetical protein
MAWSMHGLSHMGDGMIHACPNYPAGSVDPVSARGSARLNDSDPAPGTLGYPHLLQKGTGPCVIGDVGIQHAFNVRDTDTQVPSSVSEEDGSLLASKSTKAY